MKGGIFPGLRAWGSRHLVETEIIDTEELERENHHTIKSEYPQAVNWASSPKDLCAVEESRLKTV
jgi:hypothetical protein